METGEPVSASRSAKAADNASYKSPRARILQIYVYTTRSAQHTTSILSTYARKARSLLLPHRMDLRAWPKLPSVLGSGELIIEWSEPISLPDHKEQIVTMSQKVYETPADALPVILCTMSSAVDDNGQHMVFAGRSFVLIYGNKPSADAVTLLHEIGHAAGCKHEPWGLGRPDKQYNFMATPAEFAPESKELAMTKESGYYRNAIFEPNARRLETAKFSVETTYCSYPPLFFNEP